MLSLVIDPVTPTTLYAATFHSIYKTTDGGDNWAPTGSGGPVSPFALAIDPHTHTTIYATDFLGSAGIFRSTNAGASWQDVGLNDTGSGVFVKVSPHTPGLVYATMSIGGVFKSVDGGDHWSLVRSDASEIVFDPVNPLTLYSVSTPQGVHKSTDGGQTWNPIDEGLTVPIALALAVDPLRPSTLYVSIASTNDDDAFVTKINPSGNALIYSTLIGGIRGPDDPFNINDEAYAIALDLAGNAFITGVSRSPNFPITPNAYQPVNHGFNDSFISKLTMSYIISGRVLDAGGAPLSGAEVVLNDGGLLTAVVTESDGSYEFSHLREGGSFTVSAAKPHFTMAPPSQTFNNLSASQTANFTATRLTSATGNVQFSVDSIRVIEDIGAATITVLRKDGSSGNLSVDFATSDGTATAGQDYTATSGTLTFSDGETSKNIQVTVADDAVTEAEETFKVVLTAQSLETLGAPSTLVITIQDRSTAPVLELLLEESGPTVDQAAALDALLLVRDPFRVVLPDWFPTTGADRNTRVMFFVRGLQLDPGESPSAVVVRLGSGIELLDVPAEDVRSVPNVDFTQIRIRLPDGLAAGTYTVSVRAHSRSSNTGMFRIAP